MIEPKSQTEWLKNIEPDQNVSGLDTTLLTNIRDTGRHYFRSQTIQPTLEKFILNSVTGMPEYAHGQVIYATNTGNAATSVLTCPANRYYHVIAMTRNNTTRLATFQVDAVIDDVALALLPDDTVTVAVSEPRQFILPAGSYFDLGANTHQTLTGVWLRPGDTLTITDNTWVAADGQVTIWTIEERRA